MGIYCGKTSVSKTVMRGIFVWLYCSYSIILTLGYYFYTILLQYNSQVSDKIFTNTICDNLYDDCNRFLNLPVYAV